jgi:hypothetical protein
MARDLILGSLRRDWSLGPLPTPVEPTSDDTQIAAFIANTRPSFEETVREAVRRPRRTEGE